MNTHVLICQSDSSKYVFQLFTYPFIWFYKRTFLYLFIWEKERDCMSMGEGQRERERRSEEERDRKRITSRLQAQLRAWCRTWSHDPGIMTWAKIKSWMLTQLSHSRLPYSSVSKVIILMVLYAEYMCGSKKVKLLLRYLWFLFCHLYVIN